MEGLKIKKKTNGVENRARKRGNPPEYVYVLIKINKF